MARKARPIASVNPATEVVTFTNGQTAKFASLPKVEQIGAIRALGYRFQGNPMYLTDSERYDAWGRARIGAPSPVPAPKAEAEPTPKPTPTPTPKVSGDGSLDSAIRAIVAEAMADYAPTVDMTDVNAAIAATTRALSERIDKLAPKVTQVVIKDRPTIKVDGVQHAKFPKVLAMVAERTPAYLFGPAGTGKSTIGETCAKALGLDFFTKSCSSQMTESSLLGYNDANGRYVPGALRAPFERGGVFVLDEVDNANPNILSVLNSAIANGVMAFPDGMVRRHDDFVLVATANTVGNGATQEYVGRNPLDKAFLDRFAKVEIGYDESVEDAMLASVGDVAPELAQRWLATVRQARKNVADYGLKVIVSPRATLNGAKLLRQGFSLADAVEATITAGMSPDQSTKVMQGVTL